MIGFAMRAAPDACDDRLRAFGLYPLVAPAASTGMGRVEAEARTALRKARGRL